mgnify:CR=1 FL=1
MNIIGLLSLDWNEIKQSMFLSFGTLGFLVTNMAILSYKYFTLQNVYSKVLIIVGYLYYKYSVF